MLKGIQELSNGRKMCLCPFDDHTDTRPSFIIYPDGFYRCYGCGRMGKLSTLLGAESKYEDLSNIDVDYIRERTIDITKVRTQIEARIKKLTGSVPDGTINKLYDRMDMMFIVAVCGSNRISKIELISKIKQEAKRIEKEVLNGIPEASQTKNR